jgi:hypothetical protein
MPRRAKQTAGITAVVQEYQRLEHQLVLVAWGCAQLGYESNRAMLDDLRNREEGFEAAGRSHITQAILSRGSKCKVSSADLERYDRNIHAHLASLNRRRAEPITLRYFQHVSLLLTELFLDRLFNHELRLRAELRAFVDERNARRGMLEPQDPQFTPEDLTKLAYWMATGSGKTILMHFHYHQYLQYCKRPLDNILLVTPDEALSQQHLDNMEEAGIPCRRFSLEDSGLEVTNRHTVRVVEITKLVEQKKGSGVSVPVEAFEGNNLIFVDEGHRGAGSEAAKWIGFRQKLAKTGFTFEYSATFGQAMVGNSEMTAEYGKAILFDYSYKYFYGDGFGKDFEVLNLRQEVSAQQTDTLLLANLLAFYQQKQTFADRDKALRAYNVADPLWIFVGSTVNKSTNNKQAKDSDVLTVVAFLQRFLVNEGNWVPKRIETILGGKSGIEDDLGNDVFYGRFGAITARTNDGEAIQKDLLRQVFHAETGGKLHVATIKGEAGELGLKVGGAAKYFGLIYIGDTASFKTLIEEGYPEIELEEDKISDSLFEGIKRIDSEINVLIGAKKFMQGWDSWRVTNMGLLNIGRSEGTEIIQLFGRGVRLKGLNRSLKRSSAIAGVKHPKGIELLERLNIFAIRANYMTEFRNYLAREGVDPDGEHAIPLAIKQNVDFVSRGLISPRLPPDRRFADNVRFLLEKDDAAKVTLDLSVRLERIGSEGGRIRETTATDAAGHWIPESRLDLLNWSAIDIALVEHKETLGFSNLIIRYGDARKIAAASDPKLYSIVSDESVVKPRNRRGIQQLEETMAAVLRRYIERYYRTRQQRWDSEQMIYEALKTDDANFQDYVVKVPRSDKALVKTVYDAIEEWKKLDRQLSSEIPNLHFDRHLYQPLLVQKKVQIRSTPVGLNESERRFVQDLINFTKDNPTLLDGKELYLLRNLTRGKGIGFFEKHGFYPDFLMWVITGDQQRLVFVDPKGMRQEDHPHFNEKINLHTKLREVTEPALRQKGVKNLTLDAYIISATEYDELKAKGLFER